jgi:hypothetical protein
MPVTDRTDDELTTLFVKAGIDLGSLPVAMTAKQLAGVFDTSEDALAQARKRGTGVPWVRYNGRHIRYLRADVARFLLANRTDPQGVA